MSLPVSYFPSVRPSAIVLGTVFEHVSSFIVYGPLFGQTWQKAMSADKVSPTFYPASNAIKVDMNCRTRNSGRARKLRMLPPSTALLSSLLVFRYPLFPPIRHGYDFWFGRLMLLPRFYNSLEPSRTREPRLLVHWFLLLKLFPRSWLLCSMRNVLLDTLASELHLDCFKPLDWLYVPRPFGLLVCSLCV
jgi:hypothetical protein